MKIKCRRTHNRDSFSSCDICYNATCRYTCVKETATYDTPRGLNVMREDEKEPWPMCSPQVYSKF